jgi:hypothetical protein
MATPARSAHLRPMLTENVPTNPSPEQPHERPYDPPQPDPQALDLQIVGSFANRRDWRVYLCTANRAEAGRHFSAAARWLRNR